MLVCTIITPLEKDPGISKGNEVRIKRKLHLWWDLGSTVNNQIQKEKGKKETAQLFSLLAYHRHWMVFHLL